MYRVGVVGLGFIGKKHTQIIEKHLELELSAVCDIDEKKLSEYSCYKTVNFEDFLNQDLDIVVIATPNYLHATQTIAALKSGMHVICEKPLAIKSEDALQMIEIANLHQRVLFCMLQNRFSPIVQWLKQIITEKKLGKIFWAQVNCAWNRDERYYHLNSWKGKLFQDGGVLFTQFSHFTDILIYLFGPLATIGHASFWNFNHQKMIEFEDSGCVHFKLFSQVQVTFQYTISAYDQNLESSLTIFGEKGTIKIGGQYMNEVIACHAENCKIPEFQDIPAANQYPGFQGSASGHHWVYQEFIETLRGNSPKVSSVIDAMHSVKLIEEIYKLRI
jgi:predicted dehydrogenase